TALFGARRIDELAERIRTETATLFRFEEFTFALVDRDARVLDVRLHERQKRRLPAGPRPLDGGLLGLVVEQAEPILVEDWADAPDGLRRRAQADERLSGSLIAVPLVADEAVIGILCMRHSRPD